MIDFNPGIESWPLAEGHPTVAEEDPELELGSVSWVLAAQVDEMREFCFWSVCEASAPPAVLELPFLAPHTAFEILLAAAAAVVVLDLVADSDSDPEC